MKNRVYDWLEHKYSPFIFLFAFACVLLADTPLQLWDQDESAYAGMARQMIESGNWCVPEFMWSDLHRKPPLHIWNIALMYKLFGIHEFSVRLSSVLFIVGTSFLVYALSTLFSDRKTALASMVVVSTSLLIPMLARIAVTDGTLLFFCTLCVYAAYRQLQSGSIKWLLLLWSSFALALLTKGPPIVIFALIFFFLLLVFYPQRTKLTGLHPWFGFPLACVPLVLWAYCTTTFDGGKLLDWMIDFYVLKRVNSSMFGQTGPPGTHLVIILASFIPYVLYLPGVIKQAYLEFKQKNSDVIFLVCWFVAAWLVYEFSPSKLPSYTVAAHVPLAILVARYSGMAGDSVRKFLPLHLLLNMLVLLAIIVVPFYLGFPEKVKLYWTIFGVVLLLLNTTLMFWKGSTRFWLVAGIALALQLGISTLFLPVFDLLKLNTRAVALQCGNAPDNAVALIGNDTGLPPSLPFYLKQHLKQVQGSYYVSDWLVAYYNNTPSILILNATQAKAIGNFIADVQIDTVPSYRLEQLGSYDYMLVKNNAWTKRKSIAESPMPIQEPASRLTVEEFEIIILNNKEWMVSVAEKAKKKNLSLREMVTADAVFLYDYQNAVYALEQKMRQSHEWLQYLKRKADRRNVPIEVVANEEAKAIVELHNIQ